MIYDELDGDWETPTGPRIGLLEDETFSRKEWKKFKYWAKANVDPNDYAGDIPIHQLRLRPRPYKTFSYNTLTSSVGRKCFFETVGLATRQTPQVGYLTDQRLFRNMYQARCVARKTEKIRAKTINPIKTLVGGYHYFGNYHKSVLTLRVSHKYVEKENLYPLGTGAFIINDKIYSEGEYRKRNPVLKILESRFESKSKNRFKNGVFDSTDSDDPDSSSKYGEFKWQVSMQRDFYLLFPYSDEERV